MFLQGLDEQQRDIAARLLGVFEDWMCSSDGSLDIEDIGFGTGFYEADGADHMLPGGNTEVRVPGGYSGLVEKMAEGLDIKLGHEVATIVSTMLECSSAAVDPG